MNRRHLLTFLGMIPFASWARSILNPALRPPPMIKSTTPIDLHWPTQEPFLFCAHHLDRYPAGNANLGLDKKHFAGREMGSDFEEKDGFRIYHGAEIPGFPVHPHRGFETITIVRRGYADHADSLGAAGRYGEGDVQWMTAGSGVQHSEMFPLLHKDKENTLELFQIWLNLPKKNKMVPADFKMLWSEKIPRIKTEKCEVTLVSGEYEGKRYFEAPKNSWAADSANNVNILLVKLQAGGEFKFAGKSGVNRSLYFFEGKGAAVNGEAIQGKQAVMVEPIVALSVTASAPLEFLLLEAKPIGEPVAQHGPFVMNTREEIVQTFNDYQKTQFGGWKWNRQDMIHGPGTQRFAKYPDGRVEKPV
jgi:redox-sensitive bicupin YhaK (pirin superfamily)